MRNVNAIVLNLTPKSDFLLSVPLLPTAQPRYESEAKQLDRNEFDTYSCTGLVIFCG